MSGRVAGRGLVSLMGLALLGLSTVGCGSVASLAQDGGADAAAGSGGAAGHDAAVETAPETRPDAARESSAEVAAADATPNDAAEVACVFKATYTFHDDGGLRASVDTSTLRPPRAHTITRTTGRVGGAGTCARDLPCTDPTAVSVSAIEAAIADADVQAALGKPKGMLYGSDPRPVDGTVWVFERDDGHDFSVGSGAVPAGLRALETLLRQLSTETLAAPACVTLAP